jgi:hypothetical protein
MDRDSHSDSTDSPRLNVLFVSGFDSANYATVEIVRELEARGHRCTVLVEYEGDAANTAMFTASGIPIRAITDYPPNELDSVDMVFAGPHLRPRTRPLVGEIQRRGMFVVSLANLFSAVTMNVAPDLAITNNTRKFAEFEANGLRYRAVAVGNPQYDPLVRVREARRGQAEPPVRRVLVVDQGAYPLGETGKRQLAETIIAIARNNPDLELHVKPRHLPHEAGDQVHSVSEHLYSYLTDIPENVTLIQTPAIIEQILPDFDAMITTWSTAHLAAVALGIPLVLIGGLDSIDVYDVRSRRVAEAYERLHDTGCVVDWRVLRSGSVPFARVSPEYEAQEFDPPAALSAPRIADLLETIDRTVLSRGARFATGFQLDYASFMRNAGTLETVLDGPEPRRERRLRVQLNSILQPLVFDNRCMGFALDMRRMLPVWNRRPEPGSGEEGVRRIIRDARDLGLRLKQEYFAANPDKVADDVFAQDAYFDWLLATERFTELYDYAGRVVAPQSLEFDRGMAALRRKQLFRAARHFVDSFSISLLQEGRVLKKDKNIRSLLSRTDRSLGVYAILFFMNHHRKYEALSLVDVPAKPNMDALLYYKMKALVRLGRRDEAAAAFREYDRAVDIRQPAARVRRLPDRLLRILVAWYHRRLYRLATRLG